MSKTRAQLLESNFGRDFGWIVEFDGTSIAELNNPRQEDMFWDSYQLKILTDDPEMKSKLLTNTFWLENSDLKFKNKGLEEEAVSALTANQPFTSEGRLMLRGAYLTPEVTDTKPSKWRKIPSFIWLLLLGMTILGIILFGAWLNI